jgi:hypothetical protein
MDGWPLTITPYCTPTTRPRLPLRQLVGPQQPEDGPLVSYHKPDSVLEQNARPRPVGSCSRTRFTAPARLISPGPAPDLAVL